MRGQNQKVHKRMIDLNQHRRKGEELHSFVLASVQTSASEQTEVVLFIMTSLSFSQHTFAQDTDNSIWHRYLLNLP